MDPQPNSRLTGYYDFRAAPLTFDFATYLGILCGTAHEMRAPSIALNLVVPWFRNSNFLEKGYMDGYREWKFQNVIMKLVSLVPAISDVAIVKQGPVNLATPRFPSNYHPSEVNLNTGLTQIPCNFSNLEVIAKSGWRPNIFKARH